VIIIKPGLLDSWNIVFFNIFDGCRAAVLHKAGKSIAKYRKLLNI
jgi:hypothetical protein